ncbi:MAG: LptE family protein [Bacteroidales bacterium]|nr:LptE family protein [Bacteroidales bacterium]
MELNPEKYSKIPLSRFFLLLPALLITLFSGCTVSYKFTGASTQGLNTVSIQYFQNRASLVQPGLSQVLTDALIDKCKSQTNLKTVNGIGDANFEGEISDYNTRPLTVAADAQAAMNRFSISVKVKFVNSVDPDLSFEQTFSRYEDYNSNLDLSQVEKDLTDKIVEMIVEDIFNQAFVNW